ncbi:metalloregulator ArsR/SmtB family transcription factor [Sphingobium sufflavum]|uniref:ArsR/SmtB family transcription factor n=1 Tax=Sphingobium sufflavum TaxID=1129547 RepID=UPI001F18849E|nr:metalloregulator ArsR/SmtB family transcription factor [Sphingobium sufflavum]MCE7798177.1 metalloregulator ArsR/SmtB family transcription factor [Sphingobium sufflavum]
METEQAVLILAALGQPTRLEVFRLLVRTDKPIAAGDVAAALNIPRNTMSSHLAVLSRAALIRGVRSGKNIFYSANLTRLRALTAYLVDGCCADQPGLCDPELSEIKNLSGS